MTKLAAPILVLGLLCPLSAQAWSRAEYSPRSRLDTALAYDSARDRAVLYGSYWGDNVTWEWDGGEWAARYTDPYPRALRHRLVYDEARRTTWLFDFAQRETWAYDGRQWSPAGGLNGPGYRESTQLVFDRGRGVAVLFGGVLDHHTVLGDTWEWDGSAWHERHPPVEPAARGGHWLVYDPVAGHVVMFGGSTFQGLLQDTWTWDGTYWVQQQATVKPSARWASAGAFDPVLQRPLLFGGGDGSGALDDTWVFQGPDWQQLQPAHRPPLLRATTAMVSQRAGVLMYTGGRDTWGWDGSDWSLLDDRPAPPLRDATAAADRARGRIVLFGDAIGSSTVPPPEPTGTWEWTGQGWQHLLPPIEPPPRGLGAMAHDALRGVTLLFGGRTWVGYQQYYDTWEWDGSQWTERFPATVPQLYGRTTMFFDAALGRNVLVGEHTPAVQNGFFEWTWDGSDWQPQPPTPGIGSFRAAAFDAARGVPVALTSNGTFERVGNLWVQRAPPGTFIGNFDGRGLAYDGARQRVVAIGYANDQFEWSVPAWAWDGAAWTPLPAAQGYGFYGPRLLVEDPSRDRLALIGGYRDASAFWYLTDTPATDAAFGSACGGSAGEVTISARGQPRTGNADFALEVDHALPGALVLSGLSIGEGNLPLGNGCSWYFGSQLTSFLLVADGAGFAAVDVPIPPLAALRGLPLAGQAFALDPLGPHLGALAASAGLRLVVGD